VFFAIIEASTSRIHLILFNSKTPSRCGKPEWDGQAIPLDDPRIPAPIRDAASARRQPGDTLYFIDTDQGGEWWLMNGDELIEAFWLER
jgi:hypothetical protein